MWSCNTCSEYNSRLFVAVCCGVFLQCVAVCCLVLQCRVDVSTVALQWHHGSCHGSLRLVSWVVPYDTGNTATLQHAATHCNILQHTATHPQVTNTEKVARWMKMWCGHSAQEPWCLVQTSLIFMGLAYKKNLQHRERDELELQHAATHYKTHCAGPVTSRANEPYFQGPRHGKRLHNIERGSNCNTLQHTATHCNTLSRLALLLAGPRL